MLKVKVCGLNDPLNFLQIADLPVDMVGLNFYKPSKRYVSGNPKHFKSNAKMRVGVFVQSSLEEIEELVEVYKLDYIQLHGDEDSDFCKSVQQYCRVIKVFRVEEDFDFNQCRDFDFCNAFLFDTKVKSFGGEGKQFDWTMLDNYKLEVPFFLSGGIGFEDLDRIKEIKHAQLIGVDINSCFESAPGIKKIELVKEFIQELNQ